MSEELLYIANSKQIIMTNDKRKKYKHCLPISRIHFFLENLETAGSAVPHAVSILQLCANYGFFLLQCILLYYTAVASS